MDQDTFIATFRRCFDYPDPTEFTTKQIDQLENQVTADQWSSKKVLDDFEALYSDLKNQQRNHITDARQPLIELREKERDQRKNIRQALSTALSGSLDPISVTVNEFINVCLSQLNQDERQQVQEQMKDGLSDLRVGLYEDSFDADTFRRIYWDDGEDELEETFLELYQYLRQRGWHRRDLHDIGHRIGIFHEDFDQLFEWIADLANRKRNERTYVFFVSGLQVLEEIHRDDYIYAIAPSGELQVDDLVDIYPYDDINELDLHEMPGPENEPTIAEMLEEKTLIAFPIEAYGTYGGRDRALERLSEILDLFSYSHSTSQVQEPHFRDKAKYLVWRDNGESRCTPASVTESGWEATLFEWDIHRIFEKLVPASQHDSPLSTKLARGLHFFRKGNNTRRDIDTIIYYIACLETITRVGRVYRDEVIEKGLLLGKVRESDMETFRKALQRIYEFRNEALHAGLRQVDTRGEVDLMRGILKTALEELAEAINEESVDSIPEFLSYFRAKKQATYEDWLAKIDGDGFEVDRAYAFTGTMYNVEDDVKGDVTGEVEFVEDGQFITPTVTIDDLDKAEDFEFGEGLAIEATVQEKSMRIDSIRENNLTVMSINQGSFSETDPWQSIFKDYTMQ
jgi:hypothetical protein